MSLLTRPKKNYTIIFEILTGRCICMSTANFTINDSLCFVSPSNFSTTSNLCSWAHSGIRIVNLLHDLILRMRSCVWPLLSSQERYRGSNSVHGAHELYVSLARRSTPPSQIHIIQYSTFDISLSHDLIQNTHSVCYQKIYMRFPTFLLWHIYYLVCVYNSHGTSLLITWDVLLTYLSDDLMLFRFS